MPIYEYQCKSCHHHFDLMQKINDEPVKQCPKCFENALIKLVSAAGFQLKGTGWYATDFKNKGGSNKGDGDKKEGATAASEASSSKTDSPKQESSSNKTSTTKGDTE